MWRLTWKETGIALAVSVGGSGVFYIGALFALLHFGHL